MSRYARNTAVPVDRSKSEIERTLTKYGAKKFAYFAEENRASIAFEFKSRHIRMRLALPTDDDFIRTDKNRTRTPAARVAEREKSIRQRWRAMLLVIKAKLEAIEAGIATFEDEWLAYVVLADGTTVGEKLAPQLADGRAPKTLMLGMDK
jgi:hypothetical protein